MRPIHFIVIFLILFLSPNLAVAQSECANCDKALDRDVMEQYLVTDEKEFEERLIKELLNIDFNKDISSTKDKFNSEGTTIWGIFNVANDYEKNQIKEMYSFYRDSGAKVLRGKDKRFIYQRKASQTIFDAWIKCMELKCNKIDENRFLNYGIVNISGNNFGFKVTFRAGPGSKEATVTGFTVRGALCEPLYLEEGSHISTEGVVQPCVRLDRGEGVSIVLNTDYGPAIGKIDPVKASLPSITFDSSSTLITCRQPATLSWNVINANSVSITPDIGEVDVKGRKDVTPSSTTTYTLRAKGAAGDEVKEVTIAVGKPKPRDYSIALSTINNFFLSAPHGGGPQGHIKANKSDVGPWETFTLTDLNGCDLKTGDYVTIRTHNRHYLIAEKGGGDYIYSYSKTGAAPANQFKIIKTNGPDPIKHKDHVVLQVSNGQYMWAIGGTDGTIGGNQRQINVNAKFIFIDLNPD